MATRGGAARAASEPAAFPAATTGSTETCEDEATAVRVPVNIEFAPVFDPVSTAPIEFSHGVSSTSPAGNRPPIASLIPVVVMIQPMSMNAAVPTPMGTQEPTAETETERLPSTAMAAMRQAAASQNGGEAMICVSSEGSAECRPLANNSPIVSTP